MESRDLNRVVLIEDDDSLRAALTEYLEGKGYEVAAAADGMQGLTHVDRETCAVITDLKLPGISGLEVLERIKSRNPATQVIIATGYGSIDTAVAAMRQGAYHFVTKPINPSVLLKLIEEIAEKRHLRREVDELRRQLDDRYGFENLIGRSPKMVRVFDIIRQVAPTRATVLISGESGTGKELVARAVHQNSPRKDRPFVAINCAALPSSLVESELFGHEKGAFTGAVARREGLIQSADRGTLFIDEIGELDGALQAKLLRVLENRTFTPVGSTKEQAVDIRILAATNRELEADVKQGRFREDLFYRLCVVRIELPPLRERRDDIPLLAKAFLDEAVRENGLPRKVLAPEVVARLASYSWPGNVRELKNVIESMAVLSRGETIGEADLPVSLPGPAASGDGGLFQVGMTMEDLEKNAIAETLHSVSGNRTKAAKILEISLRTLQRKIKEYALQD
ncbi:MAG: sigma-54 dependent transcriptional regulator [Planctomycetota bacterium]